MRPHFKRFFRSMAQKDLLLSDACLPFCGHSLLFFCRRFLFQIKRKCRNAGSIYRLTMVCSEGRNQLATIQPSYNFVSASPISDSRKGCPYEVRCLKIVQTSRADNISFSKVVMISNITAVDRCRYLYLQIPIRLILTAHQQPFTSSEHLHFRKNML